MSKFQIALTYIKKYIFWLITIICLLVTMVVSSAITGGKADSFDSRVSAIEGRFSEMQRLRGQDNPNEPVVLQKQADVKNLKDTILDAWNQLYLPQANFFENGWPEFRNRDGQLDANASYYLDEMKRMWASQTIYESPAQSSLPGDVADAYRNYVVQSQERDFMNRYKIYVPENAQGVNGAVVAAAMQGLTDETGTASQLPTEGNLTWDETNRQQMRDRFSRLNRAIGKAKVNSTRKLLVVQEDIWTYNLLLNAITLMNKNCEGSHDAVVKRIFEIDIAEDASTLNPHSGANGSRSERRLGSLNEKNQNVGFDAAERVVSIPVPEVRNTEEMSDSMMSGDLEEEEGSGTIDEEFLELFDYRYCDIYGNFMSADQLTEFLKTKPEYKLMPVHVHILIAQEQIPQFMLNCLNADMPIYVHQISVRARDLDAVPHQLTIEPELPTTGEDEEGMAPARPTRTEHRTTPTPTGNQEGITEAMGGATTGSLTGEVDKRKPGDVEFELWGMVCVFNVPDESKYDEIIGESSEDSEDSEESDKDSESDEDSDEMEEGDDVAEDSESDVDAEVDIEADEESTDESEESSDAEVEADTENVEVTTDEEVTEDMDSTEATSEESVDEDVTEDTENVEEVENAEATDEESEETEE